MMKNTINYNLLARYITGNCTPAEAEQADQWIQENEENESVFNQLYGIWENTGELSLKKEFDENTALDRVQFQLDQKKDFTLSVKKGFPAFVKIAAAILIVFLTGILIYKNLNTNVTNLTARANDTLMEFILEDGSKVWLNKNSILQYPDHFKGNERNIFLEGEAYFQISENPYKAFVIETHESKIRVLGTSFNVRANTKMNNTIVSVTSGKVQFTNVDNSSKVYLEKGEMGILQKQSKQIDKKTINNANFLSWKTGILKFENTPFEEAINEISRYYNKKINIEGEALKTMKFNSYFDNQPFHVILEILKNHDELQVIDSLGVISITTQKD